MCRSQQVLPPDAFGSLVHCLAVIADDLWCALGSGSLVVYSLASREIRIKVLLQCCQRAAPSSSTCRNTDIIEHCRASWRTMGRSGMCMSSLQEVALSRASF